MSSKFVISVPKNPYTPNLNTDSAKIAKPTLLGVVFANLRVCLQFLIKNSLKFLLSDPKNPFEPNLNT